MMRWLPLLGLVFLAGVILNVYPLAVFAVMLIIIVGVARFWQQHALDQVSYSRSFNYRRGFPAERLEMQAKVENRKFLPISWLRVQDPIPTSVGPEDESLLRPTHLPEMGLLVSLFGLRWYERDRRNFTLLLRKRGIYRVGPALLSSGDLFGMFEEKEQQEGSEDVLTVFPEPMAYDALRLPTDDPFGDRRSFRRLYEDPNLPMGVRDYQPDDDFRRIHWLATARTGQLQVKVYQPISAQVMVICLNASTMVHFWEGYRPELLEQLVSVAATLVQRGIEDGYRVGLVSNGCLGAADQPFRVMPGRSPGQLFHLLAALAGVTPIVAGAFERFLLAESTRLPYRATLVVVSALINPVLIETLLRLKQHGHRITLFSLSEQSPPDIPGLNLVHLPFVA